nr:hypothetical protein F41F3.7 - Caenorhabditis elegans [Caenorhabditis elegans]
MYRSYNYLPISLETLLILSTVNIYVANDVLTILVAINRFIAMFAPFYYDKLCSIKVTAACISLIYLNRVYATMTKSYNLFDGGCRIYTSLETFATTYEDPSCKKTSDNGFSSFDVLFGAIGFLGIALILNLFTFSKILRFYLGKNGQRSKETSMSIRKNIRMFFQTVLQDSLFLIDVLFTYKFSTLSKARIWLFISIILVWESIYMLDG